MKIRNKNENIDYTEYLKSAISEARQAVDAITYISYPEVNQRTIAKLNKAIHIMNEALDGCIFKP
jgi:hypothetical protein